VVWYLKSPAPPLEVEVGLAAVDPLKKHVFLEVLLKGDAIPEAQEVDIPEALEVDIPEALEVDIPEAQEDEAQEDVIPEAQEDVIPEVPLKTAM